MQLRKKRYSVTDRQRGYTYVAMLHKDGRLELIKGGCRRWFSFKQAFDHYSPTNNNPFGRRQYEYWRDKSKKLRRLYRWSDREVSLRGQEVASYYGRSPKDQIAYVKVERQHAIDALTKLEAKVTAYRQSIKKPDAKRKPKRTVKRSSAPARKRK